jgi:hypothetical protein
MKRALLASVAEIETMPTSGCSAIAEDNVTTAKATLIAANFMDSSLSNELGEPFRQTLAITGSKQVENPREFP